MSETDDTDELLIIPPDFFLTNPVLEPRLDDFSPYYNIVDSLISQVNKLENRIDFLQSSSDLSLSLISNSTDMINSSPTRLRKFNSHEDLPQKNYSTSTQSTPQKPRTKFTMNSLPNSPDTDRIRRSPRREQNKSKKPDVNPMLGEIDNFISNVKLIKRINAARNLDGDFSSLDVISNNTKSLDMEEVDAMIEDLELQQRKREDKIKSKEQEIFKQPLEKPILKEQIWQVGENLNSVPDYGLGMRANMYPQNSSVTEAYTKVVTNPVNQALIESSIDKSESSCSSEPTTQVTSYEKRNYIDKSKDVGKRLQEVGRNYNLGLVSLANLWSSNDYNNRDCNEIPSKFQQKLQEERLRRQHCEQAIQDLQNRILELQERVAVAIQVDEAKDKAILRFHHSWEQSSTKLEEAEQENAKLNQDIDKLQKKIMETEDETQQKILRYENEASKALNIAHTSQEKLSHLEKRFLELENEFRIAETNSEEFQKKYMSEVEKNKQYPEIIAQKELEMIENKNVLAEARNEVHQSRKAVEICQNEFIAMKTENESLTNSLLKEQEVTKKLTEQKNQLEDEISIHKNIVRGVQDELNKTREQLENNKLELKNYYQGQVELVVQNKLKEFQSQLDEAEKKLKEEFTKKEMSIAKTAASHIQQISEKHSLEIKLLEEKHQEECRLYKLQMSQLHREIDESNHKLKRQHDRHINIERQLHKFMESLKQDATVEEINSFRSKSFTNLEEILGLNVTEEDRNKKSSDDQDKTEQATYRLGETPISSRTDKGARRKDNTRENNLQETIQMLLMDRRAHGDSKSTEEFTQQAAREGALAFYQRLTKDMKGKPPWK